MADDSIVEKMMILRDTDDKIVNFLLPAGLTLQQVRAWTDRFMQNVMSKSAMQQKRVERFEGRTFKEEWAKPAKYANISGNTPNGDFDVGVRILDLIETEGRQDINELHRELAAVDPEPFALIVNMLRKDHYLQDHTEHNGDQTLELLTREERAKILSLPPPKPREHIVMPCLAYVRDKMEDVREPGLDIKL